MRENSVPTSNDRRLLARCLDGDSEAWNEFVRLHHATLEGAVRFTFHRCLTKIPAQDVENVVQDLYTRLYEDEYRRLRSYEGRCPLSAWLRSLAIRHALNVIRDEKRRGRFGGFPLDDLPLRRGQDTEPGPSPEERDQLMKLDALIEQLAPLQRTALRMFYFDGLSYRQIAATLGIAVQTVGSVISRARDRLRASMNESE